MKITCLNNLNKIHRSNNPTQMVSSVQSIIGTRPILVHKLHEWDYLNVHVVYEPYYMAQVFHDSSCNSPMTGKDDRF